MNLFLGMHYLGGGLFLYEFPQSINKFPQSINISANYSFISGATWDKIVLSSEEADLFPRFTIGRREQWINNGKVEKNRGFCIH